jgi:hypothetical protein
MRHEYTLDGNAQGSIPRIHSYGDILMMCEERKKRDDAIDPIAFQQKH